MHASKAPRRHASWRDKLRYRFDNVMARGAMGQILLLVGASGFAFLAIVAASLVLYRSVVGQPSLEVFEDVLARTFMLILVPDPVNLQDGTLIYFTALLAIVAGLFVGGTLIGILSTAIDGKMEQLKRGRSFVAEADHTVILGWSSKIFRIVAELAIANANHPGRCVAILADRDPVEMERELRERIGNFRGTRVVCRSGKPIVFQDLELVNVNAARSVIVLSPEERKDPDSHIIKILLTAAKIVTERDEPLPVVIELVDRRNHEICLIATQDRPINVVAILPEVLIPRLLVQSCRKRGLSNVYLELFDFDGDEIYFHGLDRFPSLVGKTFAEVIRAFDTSSIIGLVHADGKVDINPPFDTVCRADDEILSISADDDPTVLSKLGAAETAFDEDAIVPAGEARTPQPERNLILGWNRFLTPVVRELDQYVEPGSKLLVASSYERAAEDIARYCPSVENHQIELVQGDTGDRRFLESLPFDEFDNILILPFNPTRSHEFEDVDAATIKTLVFVRDIARRKGYDLSITTEMLLEESRAVADVGELGDFVVGDEIVGRIIAQLSEEYRLKEVFKILLTVEGSELYLRPAGNYVRLGTEVTGYTVLEAARRRGEIYIGYLRGSDVHVNARKSERLTFVEGDKVIVVAEH